MQRQSHYYSTLSTNVSANELVRSWETWYILWLQLYVSDDMAVNTVLVLYSASPHSEDSLPKRTF